ncbi:metal ABC transporter permease [bacterium]|nr:metal ABC transporter permease [bacterium]MBU1884544.1 metal ABC transporter permease [bacterium]
MSIIEILWPAFVLAIALVFVHAIFGIEIIKRGVIFTDLAIGQIAAIGMAISIAFMHTHYQTEMTLLFALIGAGIITWANAKLANIEAFIGLLYAFGVSAIMLILSQSAEGTELFSKLSASDILFVSSGDVYKSVGIYSVVAIVMFYIYPHVRGIFKELLFFVMLAITVTSSVQEAGVLVVFALLIAPAYIAVVQTGFPKLVFAWIFGSISIIIALFASYHLDLPTGYSIIFILSVASMMLVIGYNFVWRRKTKNRLR